MCPLEMLAFRHARKVMTVNKACEKQNKSHHAPVMLPIDASAPISCNAALRLAKIYVASYKQEANPLKINKG
ncbi:hypothetical protein P5673_023988 [Acropora cervicornis]|uniref:Uncharacterized protein n=1 Tax=Acropora cervicornis TaxID=6130 RepID=A0AAD9Q4E3_ACRCE|nr:hypothetical protein P5673_023988 [Acropora cervicornis]